MSTPSIDPRPPVAEANAPVRRRPTGRFDAAVVVAALLAAVAAWADPDLARALVVAAAVGTFVRFVVDRLRRPFERRGARPRRLADRAAPSRERADESRAEIVALAAHEIRTPLAGILGLADLLAETSLAPDQTAYVRALRTSGASLLRLVDGYLDLTRLEGGHAGPSPTETSLEAVVEDVVELLAPPCQAKGLELATYVAPSLAAPVAVDPQLLRQVLINLAGNAVKFTETGGVAIEVERVAGSQTRVAFRVRDTGIGIDPTDAARIFEAWQRIEGDSHAPVSGTGLGLAIARGIVARLGGEIRLASRPGEGATFSFELDLPAVVAVVPDQPLRGRRVAVVSAAPIEPPLLVRRLHAAGAEALLAPDPRAEDLIGCDAILIDHDAPDDAAARLVALRAAGVVAPAVVLIPPMRRADLPRLRDAGFAGHLIEPVRAGSLLRTVERVVAVPEMRDRLADATRPTALDVLLVDDDEINALLGRAALEHDGHRVVVRGDAESALAAFEAAGATEAPFAAVLMDLHLPGLDGFSAIRSLRAAEAGSSSRTLVIATTADATPAAADRARACGADATLVKPIDRQRLADLLAGAPPSAARPAAASDRHDFVA